MGMNNLNKPPVAKKDISGIETNINEINIDTTSIDGKIGTTITIDTVLYLLDQIQQNTTAVSGGTPFVSTKSVIGPITVSPTTTEVKVGALPLANRREVWLLNDSSSSVFFNFSNPIVLANADSVIAFSGETIQITLDPTVAEPLYIRTDEVTTTIRIIELA